MPRLILAVHAHAVVTPTPATATRTRLLWPFPGYEAAVAGITAQQASTLAPSKDEARKFRSSEMLVHAEVWLRTNDRIVRFIGTVNRT